MPAVLEFLAGLGVLLAAGQLVVTSASWLGVRFGLTPMVVGLTLVAAGTSAPELAVVFQAISVDDTELAVGSIIGSNIANVLLVLGLVAATGAITVTKRVVRFDIPVMIGASAALFFLSLDGRLSRSDGSILFVCLLGFVGWTLQAGPRLSISEDAEEPAARGAVGQGAAGQEPDGRRQGFPLPALLAGLAVGIGGLTVAARFVVNGAEEIALSLGVPELIVGLTIVALGTSAPEIATTVIAAVRGHRELAVGNAVGSNIFNILLVFGLASAVTPGGIAIGDDAVLLDIPVMLAAAVACLPVVLWDRRLDRWEGLMFVLLYAAYLLFLIVDPNEHSGSGSFSLAATVFVAPLAIFTLSASLVRLRKRRSKAIRGIGSTKR